jgi:hypothetical protein
VRVGARGCRTRVCRAKLCPANGDRQVTREMTCEFQCEW